MRSRWSWDPTPDRLTAAERARLLACYLHLHEGEFSQAEYDEMRALELAALAPNHRA